MEALTVEPARSGDLDALVALEERAFTEDRISRRAWRHLLTRAHGEIMVVRAPAGAPGLWGAAVLLLRRGSQAGRLYSLAVAPEARGRGLGRRLLHEVEARARAAACRTLRLEVRADNAAALELYRREGYQVVKPLPDYYARGAPGLRMERTL